MDKKIKIDFDPVINYFKHLSQDMQVAWGALGLGMILIVVGAVLI